jgi:lipopolysaccharide export LptBFGC system permease protein LptF
VIILIAFAAGYFSFRLAKNTVDEGKVTSSTMCQALFYLANLFLTVIPLSVLSALLPHLSGLSKDVASSFCCLIYLALAVLCFENERFVEILFSINTGMIVGLIIITIFPNSIRISLSKIINNLS